MPNLRFIDPRSNRNSVLASAAALSLIAAGAVGQTILTAPHPALAAPIVTSGLQGLSTPSFAPLIERVKPAVVSIRVKIVRDASSAQGPGVMQDFGHEQPVMIGEGSGFFISSDGYIATNNHVVDDAKSVTVTMDDGKVLDAKVVGTDPKTDLALIKVTQPGDYPYVSFAKEPPKIGDWVVAIGNPYGLGGTVTAGIVSAKGRDIGDGPYDRFLQIDAPINKGNSGGPAFNLAGQVVGVNTAIYSPSGGSIGIGFAIPATTVDRIVTALEHGGSIARGYLGVQVQSVGPDLAEGLGLKAAAGAIVDETLPGSPAAAAGLKSGDVITAVNGQPLRDAADLTLRIGSLKPGDKITLSFLHNGVQQSAEATLAGQKSASVARSDKKDSEPRPALGLELAPGREGAETAKGVAIVGVDPNGEAAEKGLAPGDFILDVGGKPVSTPNEVKSDIATARQAGAKAILMRVQTADGARFVAFALPKA
ncbi:MAG: trypsin-like peptidase domain-containing protein [Roseiarcus sp.]|uniref:trypsin-like peptidase domain-containing protein n=1 Tax=Roseiarcus sp. TaxID=1969460 RepID=UPI003C40C189